MSEPLFSIIVPVYNTEKELERCVRSVTSQTYRDFELILVDDGSKDSSGALCDKFASEDSRVVAIHQQNAGSSEARHTGIRAAKGKYLLFLDSDDLWSDSNALAELKSVIVQNPADVICFGVEIYEDDGTYVKARIPSICEGEDQSKEQVLRHLIYSNQYFSASYVKVLQREWFLENDLFFVKGLLSGEDGEWSARVMVASKSIGIFPKAFYKRIRRKAGSITSSIGKKNILDVFRAIENGVNIAREKAENNALKELYLEYWAYQYAMLFSLAYPLRKDSDYPKILNRFKQYKWLLKYDHVKKVRGVRMLAAALGIRGAICMLQIAFRFRRT